MKQRIAKAGPNRRPRGAWVPVPVLGAVIFLLWAGGSTKEYQADWLALSLQIIFVTFASIWVITLLARSFLARGAPGLLLLACGMITWGVSGFASALSMVRHDLNAAITIHNLNVWVAGFSQLIGVAVLNSRKQLPRSRWWLLVGIVASFGATVLIMVAGSRGWTPTFFVQGQGGTAVRQFVLGSAAAMFAIGAGVMLARRQCSSTFVYCYGLGLALVALGLLGVAIQSVEGSALGWTGRAAQYLSGVYLAVAAYASARESGAWEGSLSAIPRDKWLSYALAVSFVVAAIIVRLLVPEIGRRAITVTFYPAVIFAALYGGRGPALVAAVLSAVAVLWTAPAREIDSPEEWIVVGIFMMCSTWIAWITDSRQKAHSRAEAAEAELAVAAANRQTQSIIDGATGIVYAFDLEKRFLLANVAVAKLFHSTPEKMLGKRRHEFMPQEDAERHEANDRQVIEADTAIEFEEHSQLNGREITWLTTKFPLRDALGTIYAVAGISTDISDRKRAEEASQKQAALIDISPDAILVRAMDETITFWSRGAESCYGWTRQEALGQLSHSLLKTQFPQPLPQINDQLRKTGSWSGELVHFHKDGRRVMLQSRWQVKHGGQEGQTEILESNVDITDRKKAEEALRNSEEKVRAALAHAQTTVFTQDTNLCYSWVFNRYPGLSNVTLLGRTDAEFLPAEDAQALTAIKQDVLQTGVGRREEVRFTIRGEPFYYDLVLEVTRAVDGTITGIIGSAADITERKRTEEALARAQQKLSEHACELEKTVAERTRELGLTVDQLRQAQIKLEERAETLRTLVMQLTRAEERERRRVAQLVHDDLQQLLASIRFQTDVIATQAETQELRDAGALATKLLEEALVATRTLTGELSPSVLQSENVSEQLKWLGRWMKERHTLSVAVRSEDVKVAQRELRDLIFRCIRELLFNVVKHADVNEACVELTRNNGYARILVSDEGKGYTFQGIGAPGAESGFGLTSVRERVELCGGKFEIKTSLGQGTRVTLLIPLIESNKPELEASEHSLGNSISPGGMVAHSGPARVVIVDDHRWRDPECGPRSNGTSGLK